MENEFLKISRRRGARGRGHFVCAPKAHTGRGRVAIPCGRRHQVHLARLPAQEMESRPGVVRQYRLLHHRPIRPRPRLCPRRQLRAGRLPRAGRRGHQGQGAADRPDVDHGDQSQQLPVRLHLRAGRPTPEGRLQRRYRGHRRGRLHRRRRHQPRAQLPTARLGQPQTRPRGLCVAPCPVQPRA